MLKFLQKLYLLITQNYAQCNCLYDCYVIINQFEKNVLNIADNPKEAQNVLQAMNTVNNKYL